MITREAAGTLITHAGPEIGVASTKAFTGQLTALFLVALYLAQVREAVSPETSLRLVDQLLHIPVQLEEILRRAAIYEDLAKTLFRASDFLYLGRGIHFPIALEGALKLKEISYIHAEGYPAGEMKHGPNALIDENLPTVVLAHARSRRRTEPRHLRKDALQHSGGEGARRNRGGGGLRRRRRGRQGGRSRHPHRLHP